LFLLLFAAIDFTRANNIRNTLASASYEGARNAILPGKLADDIRDSVKDSVRALNIRDAVVTIIPKDLSMASDQITVQIEVPLSKNLYASSIFLKGRTLSSSCTLTRESALVKLAK
jgi:Flp pilus assembly protein TadG